MSDHFPQEGLRGVFFEQIWCDKVNILLNGLCQGSTKIFLVKLHIREVKYKKRKLLRENFTQNKGCFFCCCFQNCLGKAAGAVVKKMAGIC